MGQPRPLQPPPEIDMTETEKNELIDELRTQGNNLGQALDVIGQIPDVDKRAMAIAVTHFQTAQMWLIRAIARPEGF
jgi:hypothetical protein